MGENKAPSEDRQGRVEVFLNDEWGSICNSGFGNESADVVCK